MKREYETMMEHISVPDGLNDRVLQAARHQAAELPEKQTGSKHLAKQRTRPVLRAAVCAACALALVVGSVQFRSGSEEGAAGLSGVQYSFGLTAYAADTWETTVPNANGGLAFRQAGASCWTPGEGYYTGCLFQVTGEGIKTVSLSVDRGGLYRSETQTGLTTEEVQALLQEDTTCSVYGEDEDGPMNAELMTALGSSVTEDYDSEGWYGFLAPDTENADWETDPRAASNDSIDTFDGARLTVTVTFADGGEQSKTYTLATGRLKAVFQEDGPGCILLPQLAGDDEPYVYGIYAVSETESRWLQWPVQGANTISLSNDYGDRWNPGGQSKTFHSGIDIPAESGTPILAAADGTVTETGFDADRGNYLLLDHGDGLTTLYAHCQSVDVTAGDTVQAGAVIATVGNTGMSTGPHLHFEVRQDGEAQNPTAYFNADTRAQLRMG